MHLSSFSFVFYFLTRGILFNLTKFKYALEQAMKTQRGSRGAVLLFL